MDFQDYIKTLNIITIPVLIRANSEISIPAAHAICVERVDRVAAENSSLNVWLELTDLRDGNRYTIFSKSMMAKYAITNQINMSLDMVAIRQAIAQSHPDAINKLIYEALANFKCDAHQVPTAQEVANTLKNDQTFVQQLRPIETRVDLVVESQDVTLGLDQQEVTLSVPESQVEISAQIEA